MCQSLTLLVLAAEYVHQLPINRFRPNILLSSDDGADGDGKLVGFEEDNWAHLEVFPPSSSGPVPYGEEAEGKGKGIFCLARCGRCTVPGIDTETGVRDGILPARVLQRFRVVDQNQPYKVCFGMLSSPRETCTFRFFFFHQLGLRIYTDLVVSISWCTSRWRYGACYSHRYSAHLQKAES